MAGFCVFAIAPLFHLFLQRSLNLRAGGAVRPGMIVAAEFAEDGNIYRWVVQYPKIEIELTANAK